MNVDGDVTRALVTLASANACGTIALHLDVHASGGYVDRTSPVMHEGYAAGVGAVRHDGSAVYINVNDARAPMDTKNAVEISFAANVDVDVSGIKQEAAY